MAPRPDRAGLAGEPLPRRSVSVRWAWYTTGRRGQRVTAGWPGTGLFLTELFKGAAPRGRNTRAVLFWLAVLALLVTLGSFSHARADALDWKPEVIDGLSMTCTTSPSAEKTIIASSEAVGDTVTVYDQK